jgi:ribonuclease-3
MLGVRVRHPFFYLRALVHPSARQEIRHAPPDHFQQYYDHGSYERLEFLGDSVLRLIISNYLYHRYPGADEGTLTRIKSNLERRETLALLCERLGLERHVQMSAQAENERGGRQTKGLKEDVFEAIVAAMYLDLDQPWGKLDETTRWVVQLYERHVPEHDYLSNRNYKDILQIFTQQSHWPLPVYEECKVPTTSTPAPFTVHVHVNGRILGKGINWRKRIAEQYAAKQACEVLGLFSAKITTTAAPS